MNQQECDELIEELLKQLGKKEILTPRQGLEEYKKGYAKAEEDLQIEKYLYKNYMDLLADTLEEVLDAWIVGESVEEAKALYDKARQILPKHR